MNKKHKEEKGPHQGNEGGCCGNSHENAQAHHNSGHSHGGGKTEEKNISISKNVFPALAFLVVIMLFYNQYQLFAASSSIEANFAELNTISILASQLSASPAQNSNSGAPAAAFASTGDPTQDAINLMIPTGTPAVYGQELGISFDDPIKSMEIMAQLDPAYGQRKVFDKNSATPAEWNRYVKLLTIPTITCEFCCGAKTAVTSSGSPACGCKHVWAIRGLSAYLIRNHPDMSDDEVLSAVMKWKPIYFPKQMIGRFLEQSQSGQYTPDIAAILYGVDTSSLNIADAGSVNEALANVPSMVGGC